MIERAGGDRTGVRGSDATVLVVEDDPDIADLYRNCLDAQGYDVRMAYTVRGGLDSLGDDVDIAILDRRLPDGEGTDVLTEIRDRDLDVRVAMITAVVPDFDIIEMGFDLYLLKPVSRANLLEVVDTLLTRTEYDAKLQQTASLVSKRAVLEVGKDESELQGNDDYRRLVDHIEELDAELDDLTQEFTMEDYRTLFREIGSV